MTRAFSPRDVLALQPSPADWAIMNRGVAPSELVRVAVMDSLSAGGNCSVSDRTIDFAEL